jgi:alpha-mannosidase
MKKTRPILYLIVNNHFDPTWRRCWDRHFQFKGQTFVSYADLEEYYMLDNLALAAAHPEYKFEAEFSLVVQKFLERHPERLEELRSLAREGRFGVTGGGQVIVDANLIQGESLARNYVVGLLWVERVLGQVTRLGVRNDGFGNPAQLPQIMRGVELDWVTGMSYSPARGSYWRGLDGSTIFHAHLPSAGDGGDAFKYSPCPQCNGEGGACPRCGGRGIDVVLRAGPHEVDPEAFAQFGAAEIRVTPEEVLPDPAMLEWAKAHQDEYDVRFALEQDLREHFLAQLAMVDNPPPGELHPGVELNPNNTGVYVTRIRTKQNARRQEHALFSAEWLHSMAALQGAAYPHAAFAQVWNDLLFTLFHDAITATHIDPSYAEIVDFWARIDQQSDALRASALSRLARAEAGWLTLLNPGAGASAQVCTLELPAGDWQVLDEAGQALPAFNPCTLANGQTALDVIAAVPAFGSRALRLEPAAPPAEVRSRSNAQIENERFSVRADINGLRSVYDKQLGREILSAGQYRPGELVMEHDEGSPWATLHPDQTRTGLAESTSLLRVEEHPAFQRLVFEVGTPYRAGFVASGFSGQLSVTLYRGIERLDFHLEANWDSYNHRLRAAFPVAFKGRHLYEVPYGVLERQPYPPNFHWASAGGDWPAIHWAGVEGTPASVVLFNRGTPSYQMESGHPGGDLMTLSLLRSPAVPTYLHEPYYYTMTDFDGMRDAGQHAFDFAIGAYASPLAQSSVVLDGEAYNRGLLAVAGRVELPQMPALTPGCARLAATKWAEEGDGLVLRLAEFRGTGGAVDLSLPAWAREAALVNLLERRAQPLAIQAGVVRFTLRPWEIATLRIAI